MMDSQQRQQPAQVSSCALVPMITTGEERDEFVLGDHYRNFEVMVFDLDLC
jgi:hypothetical protein